MAEVMDPTPPPFAQLSDLARLTVGGPRPDEMNWDGAKNCPEAKRWTVAALRAYYDLIADPSFLAVRRELTVEPCATCGAPTMGRRGPDAIPVCVACSSGFANGR